MEQLTSQQRKMLLRELQSLLKKEKQLADIFVFGSAMKGKEHPNDIDIIGFFREKNYKAAEDLLYKAKKAADSLGIILHTEPMFADELFQPVLLSVLHEGFSIRHNKPIKELIGAAPYFLIAYSLAGKTSSEKVMFSYALYGRKKGEGLLAEVKGKAAGRGSIMVPAESEARIAAFLKGKNVQFTEQRTLKLS
ncbi:MAG: nucleotidyltransferase domain-containing protein [Nanoarchaeota archaeon]